jgi:hypothetical protein
MSEREIEKAAKRLAEANARSEASISRIYLFPDQKQIRLVEVDEETIRTTDDTVRPFYFNPIEDIPDPSGVALIHPDEERVKELPEEWNVDWSKAKLIYERKVEESK